MALAPTNPILKKDGRKKKDSNRKANNKENEAAIAQDKAQKKEDKAARREQRHLREQQELIVEASGDSDEVKKLKAALATQLEANKVLAAAVPLNPTAAAHNVTDEVIPRPARTNVNTKDLRRKMLLAGDAHNPFWRDLHTAIRDYIHAARMDSTLRWDQQPPKKIAKVVAAVEDHLPYMRRYENSWATLILIHRHINGHKSYVKTRDDPKSYRGKVRQSRKNAVSRDDDDDNVDDDEEQERSDVSDDDDGETHGLSSDLRILE